MSQPSSDLGECVVVVTIYEGRHFPPRGGCTFEVEGKFHGEVLSTDPADHSATIDIQNELAWVVKRKALARHRMQRTPIKLQCFAVSSSNPAGREMVGYVMLDLRTAQQVNTRANWYPLLSTKYNKTRPEIRLLLTVEQPTATPAQTPSRPIARSPFKVVKPPDQGLGGSRSVGGTSGTIGGGGGGLAVAYDADGVFTIGSGTDSFVLSVTIAFASDLTSLIPAGASAAAEGPYCFFYSLLGKDESTPSFADLQSPTFHAQRNAFRIKSSESELMGFLSQMQALQVHLVAGDKLLGTANVPLLDLGRFADAGVGTKEGAFPLMHPDGLDVGTPPPALGLTMMLRKELQMGDGAGMRVGVGADSSMTGGSEASARLFGSGGRDGGMNTAASMYSESTLPSETTTDVDGSAIAASAAAAAAAERAAQRAASAAVVATTTEHASAMVDGRPEVQQTHLSMLQQRLAVHSAGVDGGGGGGGSTTMTSESEAAVAPASLPRVSQQEMMQRLDIPRHFRCGVQISAVKNVTVGATTSRVHVKYAYPFFGSAAPVFTRPTDAGRNRERSFENSATAFDFVATWNEVIAKLQTAPLVAELHSNDTYQKTEVLGSARISLASLVDAATMAPPSRDAVLRPSATDNYYPVHSVATATYKRVAELRIVLSLEDFGETDGLELPTPLPDPPLQASPQLSPLPPADAGVAAGAAAAGGAEYGTGRAATAAPSAWPAAALPGARWGRDDSDGGDTTDHAADDMVAAANRANAAAFERSKRRLEEEFRASLAKKESALLEALAREWKIRHTQQESQVKRRVDEYAKLETQLQTTLKELDHREAKLQRGEADLVMKQRELQQMYDAQLAEARDASRRLQLDVEHQTELERARTAELREVLVQVKRDKVLSDDRARKLEADFATFRQQVASSEPAQLQAELNRAMGDKLELERRANDANQTKQRYKAQWTRALREIASLQQNQRTMEDDRLKREQKELAHMRLQYLAREERAVTNQDRETLASIQADLGKLQQAAGVGLNASVAAAAAAAANSTPGANPSAAETAVTTDELRRLIEERSTLLDSGVYAPSDRIISELDRRIEALMPSPR